ncbi:hypothetical protein [Microcoleus sp. SVA1_A1]|uniref:hypothetical protein n=1 Tax=Microcoleus sp. SVA1_A1 TaxID=2818946 RepID=UPI002FD2586A
MATPNLNVRWRKGLTSFPKKKTKKKGDSLTVYKTSGIYPTVGQPALPFTNRVTLYAGQQIQLPDLLTFRLKKRIEFISTYQRFTVSRTANKWFVSFFFRPRRFRRLYTQLKKLVLI